MGKIVEALVIAPLVAIPVSSPDDRDPEAVGDPADSAAELIPAFEVFQVPASMLLGDLAGDGTWDDPDVVYYLNYDVMVPEGMSLTIAPVDV